MAEADRAAVEHRVGEPAHTPALSIMLGYGAMAPLVLGAIATWTLHDMGRELVTDLVVLWGALILIFLSGVRRGLSFRTVRGPTPAQIGMTFWLFGLGLIALLLPAEAAALLVLIVGHLSLAWIDPWAAKRGEVPLFFERLRPIQMTLAALSLGAVLASLAL